VNGLTRLERLGGTGEIRERSGAWNVDIEALSLTDRTRAEPAIAELERLGEFCAAQSEAV
jgi:hypothetical protein